MNFVPMPGIIQIRKAETKQNSSSVMDLYGFNDEKERAKDVQVYIVMAFTSLELFEVEVGTKIVVQQAMVQNFEYNNVEYSIVNEKYVLGRLS